MLARHIPFRCLRVLVFIVAPLLLSSTASGREQRLRNFAADIVVMPDGKVDVTENITFQFIGGPWHGIYREIPVEYSGPGGLNYTLFLDVKRVEENGESLRYESAFACWH